MVTNQYRNYVHKTFFRYTLSIMIFLCVLVLTFLTMNMKWFTSMENQKNNKKLAQVLDQEVKNYNEGLNQLTTDVDIIKVLGQKTRQQKTKANHLLYDFTNAQKIRSVFTLVDMDGEMICSNMNKENQNIFLQSSLYDSMVRKMGKEPEKIFLTPSRLNYSFNQTGDLVLGRSVTDGEKILGYLFFDLLDEQIYELVCKYPVDDVILTDQYNNMIFSVGRQSEDSMEKYPIGRFQIQQKDENTMEMNGKQYQIQKSEIENNKLVLYTLVSIESQQSLFRYGILFLIVVGTLMLLMLKPLTMHITNKNLYAIEELQKSVAEMGNGNMEYSLRPQVFDEFQRLNDTFQQIVLQREELQKRNSELIERKRVMEIRQLEEQINPHFIFNVLETLRYEVLIDTAKASDMIIAFANIMRYNIYHGSTIVPLQTDIEYVNDYLLLQKMRYNRRLTYSIDIPEELMELKIPKLVLQPIVENTLKHGMKNVETIHVKINATLVQGRLELCVKDNGIGIESEQLEQLRRDLEKEDIYREHIGLYNSHRVVRLLYGPSYGLHIESTLGKGTLVTILLPVDKEGEDV